MYGLANSLYEWGGYWIILLPALYWLKAVVQTTAALALAVSVYSQANGAAISPHWYLFFCFPFLARSCMR